MSCNTFMSLHNVEGVTVTEWEDLKGSPTKSCTMTITLHDGTSMQIGLFAAAPFAIKTPDYAGDMAQTYEIGVEEGRRLEREACARFVATYDEGLEEVARELKRWRAA